MKFSNNNQQFKFFCDKIDDKEYFSLIRFTHGLWDKIVEYGVHARINNVNDQTLKKAAAIYCNRVQDGGWVMTTDVMYECFYFLKNLDKYDKNIFLAVAHSGSPFEDQTPIKHKIKRNNLLFQKFIHPSAILYDGLVWKRAVLEEIFLDFISKIIDKHVILIAPNDESRDKLTPQKYLMQNLGERLGIKSFHFIDIHPKKASSEYERIMDEVRKLERKLVGDKVYLFKAGPIGTAVIIRLHREMKNAFMLDIGNVMDIFSPTIQRFWKKEHKEIIERTYSKIEDFK